MLAPAAPFGKSRKTAEFDGAVVSDDEPFERGIPRRLGMISFSSVTKSISRPTNSVPCFSTVLTASDAAAFCSEASLEPEFSEAVGRQFEGANAIGAGGEGFHNTEPVADHAGHILDQRRVDLLPMFDELLERFDPTCEREPK